jgi:hypothetical protein
VDTVTVDDLGEIETDVGNTFDNRITFLATFCSFHAIPSYFYYQFLKVKNYTAQILEICDNIYQLLRF